MAMQQVKAVAQTTALLSSLQPLLCALALTAVVVPAANAAAPVVSAATEQRQQAQQTAIASQQEQQRDRLIADMQIQITGLQEEIRALTGRIEEQDHRISQLLERQRELYRDIDRRLAGTSTPVDGTEPTTVNTVPSLPEPAGTEPVVVKAPVVTEPAKPGKLASSKDVEAEQKAYDAIFPLVRAKQYAEAAKSYLAFIQQYPDGRNAANARYWLAQVYYVQASYEEAETQFKLVLSQHGDSPKAPDAMLKLAEIEKRRGANAAAKTLFQQVIQRYPGSSSAQVAQQRLQELR
ncbi:MAG: tol-pal system protein YbgF [Permianibacter sp.]